jgi:FkbM family methyltransferase
MDGTYPEYRELDFLNHFLMPGMVFIDVGSNQGIYTVVAGHAVGKSGHVYAFEPSPSEIRKLRSNLRINRLKNVTLTTSAVANRVGETGFFAAIPRKGGFSSIKQPDPKLAVEAKEITVPMTTLDTFIKANGTATARVDFMKVDVEGAELELIEGAVNLLTTEPRPVVQFEFGYRSRDVGEKLEALGYTLYSPVTGGLRRHTLKDDYAYEDVIGVPPDKLEMVASVILDEETIGADLC